VVEQITTRFVFAIRATFFAEIILLPRTLVKLIYFSYAKTGKVAG
jgi:hypothetical protein